MRRSPGNEILLVHHRPLRQKNASTVLSDIAAFRRHSRFGVWELNTAVGLPSRLRKLEFPVIVLHYSLFGVRDYPIPSELLDYLMASRGSYKIAFFQDEYQFCRKRFAFARDFGVDCIYSLLESEQAQAVYGSRTHATRILSTLPGYVSEELVAAARRHRIPDERRAVDVGYRGRELFPYMGRAAREKTAIAEQFLARARNLDVRLDIETGEGKRLYGKEWYGFLASCRTCLGVEAGVSVFDLDGEVYAKYEELRSAFPTASFDEMVKRLAPTMDAWENRIYYRTISPRHFESAAFRVCQILHEGRYSGVLDPSKHYIPLKKDFSNFDDVVRALRDRGLRRRLTEEAYADLIASGKYSYRTFIREFDETLTRAGLHPSRHTIRACGDRAILAGQRAALRGKEFAWSLIERAISVRFPGRPVLVFLLRPILRPLFRRRRRPEAGRPRAG